MARLVSRSIHFARVGHRHYFLYLEQTTNHSYFFISKTSFYKKYQNLTGQLIGSGCLDKPARLYRTRNSVFAYHTLYGVAPEIYKPLMKEVGNIFRTENTSWQNLDAACQHYSIDVLIIKDSDTLWKSVDALKSERQPLFTGKYYSVFYCGN